MFSPLAYPDGVIFYDLITHVPPPSHLALSPFDLYREPLAVIALAAGAEGALYRNTSLRTQRGAPLPRQRWLPGAFGTVRAITDAIRAERAPFRNITPAAATSTT